MQGVCPSPPKVLISLSLQLGREGDKQRFQQTPEAQDLEVGVQKVPPERHVLVQSGGWARWVRWMLHAHPTSKTLRTSLSPAWMGSGPRELIRTLLEGGS